MTPDLLVVGAGPAGISAALRGRALDLSVRLLDGGGAPGGQLHDMHFHPADVPGFEFGDGAALAAAYARQLAASHVPVTRGIAARLVPGAGDGPARVEVEGGEPVEARAVLIASGVRRRRLEVPGAREFEGRGLTYSARRDMALLSGRQVAVVGAGDAAFENALLLAAARCQVTLLVRHEVRARAEFRLRVSNEPAIRVVHGVRVVGVHGGEQLTTLRVVEREQARDLPVDALVVKIGWMPNSEWCRDALATDADGFVTVDARLATSAPRVWAAGDVTRPNPPSIPVALGQGAQAAAAVRLELRG